MFVDSFHDHFELLFATDNIKRIAGVYLFGRLDMQLVKQNLAAVDGGSSQAARFEEACSPQPLVKAQARLFGVHRQLFAIMVSNRCANIFISSNLRNLTQAYPWIVSESGAEFASCQMFGAGEKS